VIDTSQQVENAVNGLCGISEKEKSDEKEKKMMEAVCYRDGRIEELERRCAQQSDEISQLTARFCSHLKSS